MPAITLIPQVPTFVNDEEYQNLIASTPSSFNDLPAVVKHKEENVSVDIAPAIDGFTAQDAATGTLFVLTSVLVFASATGKVFQVEYPSITLHAISRSGTKPAIYCQLDEESADAAAAPTNGVPSSSNTDGQDDEAGVEEQEYTDMRELSIIPSSPGSLEQIFEALSQCASLHPDKFDDDDEMDDAFIDNGDSPFEVFTGDEDQELSEVGKAALAHLESIIYNPFDKAEKSDKEEATEQKPDSAKQ